MEHLNKRLLCLFLSLLLVISLFGCAVPTQESNDSAYDLHFPGLEWGMTPDELCTALGLSESDYTEIPAEADGDSYYIAAVHLVTFGADAQINFQFDDVNSDGEYCLYQIILAYADDTDMQAVKAAVTEQYGEPAEQSDTEASWNSEALILDFMSEEDKAMAESHGSGAQSMAQDPVTTITWTNSYHFPAAYNDGTTPNVLTFHSHAAMYTHEGGYASLYAEE